MHKHKRPQTHFEEQLNAYSHGLTALLFMAGLVYLVQLSLAHPKPYALNSAWIFGGSLIFLYSVSALYHISTNPKTKRFFKVLDHSGIFLLIAGSYTPVLLMAFPSNIGWPFFIGQWTMAGIGIGLKLFYAGRFKGLSTAIYALMGWSIIIKFDVLKAAMPLQALWLLGFSGLAYTVGILFYALDSRIKYGHFIWHLFVMAGSMFHYYLLVTYIF